MDPGLLGAILGGSLGLLGGVIGTYFSITRTNGPRERAFMVRVSIWTWIGVTVFLVALLLLPSPWRFLMWIPYGIALPLGIRWGNTQQTRIRAEEAVSGERAAASPRHT